VDGSTDAGFQRMAWDLRYPAPSLHEHTEEGEDFPPAGSKWPLVISGNYSVRMFQKVDGAITELAGAQNFKVALDGASAVSTADRASQEEFQRKVARLYRAVSGAVHTGEEVETRLKEIRKALRETPAVEKQLATAADSIEQRDREILRALRGDTELQKRNEPVPSSISDRVDAILEGERFSLAKPTQTHMDDYNVAAGEFGEQLGRLHSLVDVDLVKLEKDMEAAGAPWTPGRVPEWKDK
jgi:chromosome segregation ATPase